MLERIVSWFKENYVPDSQMYGKYNLYCGMCGFPGCEHDMEEEMMHQEMIRQDEMQRQRMEELAVPPPKIDINAYENADSSGSILPKTYELEEGWKLGERIDFSGHRGDEPHVNYELIHDGSVNNPATKRFLDTEHEKPIWESPAMKALKRAGEKQTSLDDFKIPMIGDDD